MTLERVFLNLATTVARGEPFESCVPDLSGERSGLVVEVVALELESSEKPVRRNAAVDPLDVEKQRLDPGRRRVAAPTQSSHGKKA